MALPKPMQLFSDEYKGYQNSEESDECKYSYNEDFHVQTVLPNGWQLFDHQLHAINEYLRLKRVILAFDMGLGKTIDHRVIVGQSSVSKLELYLLDRDHIPSYSHR